MLRRRWVLFAAAAAAVALLLALPVTGQADPKGTAGDSRCLSCHAAEGMIHVLIAAPEIQQVPRGEEFNLTYTVVVPWKHHLENNAFSLNLSRAPGISFVGGEAPVESRADGTLAPGQTTEHAFTTTANTTELHVAATFDAEPLPPQVERRFLRLVGPSGRPFNSTDAPQQDWQAGQTRVVHLSGDDLILGGIGQWKAMVVRQAPDQAGQVPSLAPLEVPYDLYAGVFGNVTGVNEIYVAGAPRINYRESTSFTFRLKASEEFESATLLYKVRTTVVADVPTDHPEGHPPDMQDVALWVEWQTTPTFTGGEALIVDTAGIPTDFGPTPIYGLMRSWAYAIGYASTFLVVPSLVLGGTFGRASVLWLNRMSLGARRRVLWHNAASFGLLAFAAAHMLLFLLEPAKNWTIGALWGGASISCLILLGVTGALQQRFVAKWGFASWRYMHFGIATLMVMFILLHLGLDGTNFKFVRDALAG